jgi:MFS family permease
VQVIGARRQLILGPGMGAVGLFWLATISSGAPYMTHVLGPVILIGLGLGMSFVPMTLAATTGVPVHEAGLASGLINTTRQVGGALGLALMATVAANAAGHHGAGPHAVGNALTSGYKEAFAIAGAGLVVGAVLALLLPVPAPTPEVAVPQPSTSEPVVAMEH